MSDLATKLGEIESTEAAPAEPTPATEAEPVVEQPEPVVDEPTGVKEPEKEASPPPSEAETVAMSAHIGLRKDLNGKLEQRDTRISELESQLKEKKPAVSVFDDEDGFVQSIKDDIATKNTNDFLNLGEVDAIEKYDAETVSAAVTWAEEAAKASPFIAEQFSKTHPLRIHQKAVELHKAELARAELDDPDTLKAKIRADVRKELEEEAAAKAKEKDDRRKSIPKSLVADPSEGLSGSDWTGPAPLTSKIGEGG